MGPAMRAARAVSNSIDCAHQNRQILDPRLLTPSIQLWKIGLYNVTGYTLPAHANIVGNSF
jgi:hypothetical protein